MPAIHIEAISVRPPYYALQIKVGRFPLAADISPKVRMFVTGLLHGASTSGLSSDVFFQNEYIANAKELFNLHIPEWMPESGLGVWPDRPPPELWKLTDIFKMAAGERIPLMYRVYRITKGGAANTQAFDLLFGSGMAMNLLHVGSTDDLLKGYKDTFLPGIQQPNLRIFPFYVPLLDVKSLHNREGDELRRWLGAAHFYLRESPTDEAILVLADSDLNAALVQAGARRAGDGRWSLE